MGEVHDEVIASIESGKTKMTPRWRFILETWMSAIAGVIIILALIYLGTFTYLTLGKSNVLYLIDFGPPGWYAFFLSLPWLLIVLTLIFIMLLSVFFQRSPFGYRLPVLYSLLAVIFLIVGGAFLAIQTALYKELPTFEGFYQRFAVPSLNNVHSGKILTVLGDSFVMTSEAGSATKVVFSPNARFPYGKDFAPGDIVIVFGELLPDGTIYATGVERVTVARLLSQPPQSSPAQ
jgi:hypothetical protein